MENNRVKQIGNLVENAKRENPQTTRVYDSSGLSPTIDTMQGGNRQPMIVQKLGYMENGTGPHQSNTVIGINGLCPALTTVEKGGTQQVKILDENPRLLGGLGEKNFGKQYRQGNRVYGTDTVSMCLTSQPLGNTGGNSYLYGVDEAQGFRIRKLTPRECYRLMGFDDEAFDRAAEVNSNTQLYKQAGNSIVVDVLMAIFENLLVKGRSVWLDELLSDE